MYVRSLSKSVAICRVDPRYRGYACRVSARAAASLRDVPRRERSREATRGTCAARVAERTREPAFVRRSSTFIVPRLVKPLRFHRSARLGLSRRGAICIRYIRTMPTTRAASIRACECSRRRRDVARTPIPNRK